MGRSVHSPSRDRHRSRKRSRSRSRRDDDRERRHKSSRHKERSKKHSRTRSRSPLPSTSTLSDSIMAARDAENSDIVVPPEIAKELTTGKFDASQLSKAAMDWLEEKITEQVSQRVRDFEDLVRERVTKAKIDMEVRLRAQIEQEMKDEMDAMQKKEEESKERCLALERALEVKLKEMEESEKKLNEERLQMLEVKGKLEMERAGLLKEKEALNKTEQLSILNKGGVMRAPIRLKFGK